MWTIRGHRHIKPETLSEYSDGRLQGGPLGRVERRLAACGVCRGELESLRAASAVLRGLPVETPRRSFTLAAPPPAPVKAAAPPLSRVPAWAYAGAASVAAIALAVLVSADAAGLLAPVEPVEPGAVEALAPLTSESRAAEKPVPELAMSARAATPAPAAQSVAEPEVQTEPPAAMSEAADAGPPSDSQEAAAAAFLEEDTAALCQADETARDVPEAQSVAESEVQTRAPEGDGALAPTQEETQVQISDSARQPVPQDPKKSTAVYWRVLEVLAGVLGLLFLAGLALRWKFSRPTGQT